MRGDPIEKKTTALCARNSANNNDAVISKKII